MRRERHQMGFTLIEILVVLAIIGALAAIAIPLYRNYTVKAAATELVIKHEELQTVVESFDEGTRDCSDVLATISPAVLQSKYAALDVGFDAVQGGYAPIFRVCAEAATHGKFGVRASQAAYESFAERGLVAPAGNAVVGQSMVVYSVPLTPGGASVCNAFTLSVAQGTGCGGAGGLTPALAPAMPAVQPVAAPPKPPAPQAPPRQPIKVPKIDAYVMKFSGSDTYVRPAGEILKTDGPLSAFTVEMSFIGDPNIAAASGGQGPVMFNYGDASNAHNAISLWNPKSLTVALLNSNYDTGINVADGQTHRVSVSWDSATGRLAVLDNGQVVKSWNNVHAGETISGNGRMVVAHKSTGGGAYNAGEAFAGQIFNTAIARGAVADADLDKPLNQVLDKGSGLLADFQAVGGRVVDTTGRHTVESGGMTPTLTGVEGNLVSSP